MSQDARAGHRGLLALLTGAAAFSVANLYYAQPLAAEMARSFGTTPTGIASALVGTQLGYAAGMVLIVPLGDVRERRAVITAVALGAAVALLAFAMAPAVPLLTAASVIVGLGASVTQLILPFAIDLGPPEARGKIVGTVMSGVLAGILLSRTVSGALGAILGWRAVFVGAAVMMVVIALILRVALRPAPPLTTLPYRALLVSLGQILKRERMLRRRALCGALGFAAFSVFWSTIAFQLAESRLGGSELAGLLGVLGLTGIAVAPIIGRLAMRMPPRRINVISLIVLALAFVVFALGGSSLVAIGAGVVLLDAGAQASHLTNQTVIFGLLPAERSRVNAIYMVGYFLGGAFGTAIAAQAWQRGGWLAVCGAGAACALAAIVPLRSEGPARA